MSDFTPETRNSAMWSGDARRIASGKTNEVILTKLGKMPIPDLSGIEAVQMGHVMEPVIGQLAAQRLNISLEKRQESFSHPENTWLKTHIDYEGYEDIQRVLVECKNYNAAVRSKYDPDTGMMPPADMAQCIHEATVVGVHKVYLAVLFGGQELVIIPVEVTDQMKAEHIRVMSEVWTHVQNGTTLPPEDLDQCKLLYPASVENTAKMASQSVEQACLMLADLKAKIKELEKQEEQVQTLIQGYMQDAASLVAIDGAVLATWKSAKPTMSFDSKLFQSAMPDIYERFVVQKAGSRRFLVKG
jgi:predicted phage-related endonuclease